MISETPLPEWLLSLPWIPFSKSPHSHAIQKHKAYFTKRHINVSKKILLLNTISKGHSAELDKHSQSPSSVIGAVLYPRHRKGMASAFKELTASIEEKWDRCEWQNVTETVLEVCMHKVSRVNWECLDIRASSHTVLDSVMNFLSQYSVHLNKGLSKYFSRCSYCKEHLEKFGKNFTPFQFHITPNFSLLRTSHFVRSAFFVLYFSKNIP